VAVLKEYNDEIERLKQNLHRTREGEGVYLAQENYQEMINQIEEQRNEITNIIGEMRALKQEMDNQVQQFQLCEDQLKERKLTLDAEKERLGVAEGKLGVSRQQLQDTAQERDVQNHVVKKHLETEANLGQEARKLQVHCDVTTSDEIALQDKLNRGRKVEAENQNLQDSFLSRFQGRVGDLTAQLHQYQSEHESVSSGISEKISAGLKQNTETMSLLSSMLLDLVTLSNNSTKEVEDQTTKHSADQLLSTDQQRQIVAANIEKLNSSALDFKSGAARTFLSDMLEHLEKERKSLDALNGLVHDSCHVLTERFLSTGTSLTNHIVELEEEVVKAVQQNAGDLDAMVEGNVRTTNSLDSVKGAMDTMMLAYSSHLETVQGSRKENSELATKIALDCTEIQDTVVNKDKVHTAHKIKVINEIKADSGRKIEVIRKSVSECEEINTSESKIRESFKDMQNVFISNNSKTIVETNENSDSFLGSMEEKTKTFSASFKESKTRSAKKLEEEKENLVVNINTAGEQRSTGFENQSSEITKLGARCNEFKDNYQTQLKAAEDEVMNFVFKELKQNVPTGKTPVPVERSFPRTLSATSPHPKIVERYLKEYSVPELDLDAEMDADSVISKSTRRTDNSNRSSDTFNSQIGTASLSGSRSGSFTDLASENEESEVFKVPRGLKKPEIFFSKKVAES